MWALAIFGATVFLAYANGANDNFKGVATLFGSQTTNYQIAIWWATFTTFAGSICSVVLANALLKNFSGKGLVPEAIADTGTFTHVSVGSIFGVGVVSKTAHLGVFSQVLSSWVLTLPIAAFISGTAYFLLPK